MRQNETNRIILSDRILQFHNIILIVLQSHLTLGRGQVCMYARISEFQYALWDMFAQGTRTYLRPAMSRQAFSVQTELTAVGHVDLLKL